MEARVPVALASINAAGIGLQVQFAWRDDRHIHTISLVMNDRVIPLCESIEGTSVEDWPPSPPLQQLSVESLRPEMQVALLVGMAGKSHWSISVEPSGDRAAFVFDVACRSPNTGQPMGSGYLLLPDRSATMAGADATMEVEGQAIQLRCDREGVTAATMKVDSAGPRIEPSRINAGGTTRWRYTIELVPPPVCP